MPKQGYTWPSPSDPAENLLSGALGIMRIGQDLTAKIVTIPERSEELFFIDGPQLQALLPWEFPFRVSLALPLHCHCAAFRFTAATRSEPTAEPIDKP